MKSKRKPASQMICQCGHPASHHEVKGSSRFPIWWGCRTCDCRKFKSVAAVAQEAK